MMHRTTLSFDKEAYTFLAQAGGDNRSAFVNQLLKEEKKRRLKKALLKANLEEAQDPEVLEAITAWESTLSDGLGDPNDD